MDDLREFDRNENLDADYKDKIKNLPKGKWGKIQRQKKEEDDIKYLAHLADNAGEAGYFMRFDSEHSPEMLTATEGLLHIQSTSDQNQRFKDLFINKPQIEQLITDTIVGYQVADDDPTTGLSNKLNEALLFVVQKMKEYGLPEEDIERVFNCGRTSQNAYINKQYHNKLRLINRLQRRNRYVDSSIYNDLINLTRNWNPEEKTEKAPIEEIIQIFA